MVFVRSTNSAGTIMELGEERTFVPTSAFEINNQFTSLVGSPEVFSSSVILSN